MKKNRLLLCYSFNMRVTKMMLSWAMFALMALISSGAWAQSGTIKVKGKVTDAQSGETLIGVTVKASDGGTAGTGVDGTYTIQAGAQATLTFTYVGYGKTTVSVNNQTTINATLTADNKTLNEVVVVGYGTQKRKDVTGSIASVKLEGGPKEAVPFINPLEAIQGTPGINVGPSTTAGATPAIIIRGQSSITASTNPLLVLDGVIFNGDLNEINMNDIATFDILKDAASASIYGSRSQNGVILITTKRGKTDKPEINFNTYYGTQSWTRIPKMRQGQDYIQWRQDLATAKGSASDINSVFAQTPLILKAYNAGYTTNWLQDIQQYAPVQNYDLSVSGRTDKVNYYFSAGYINQKGVLANDNYNKPNITMKIENTVTPWLSYGVNGYYSQRDYSGIPADLYMATYLSPYSYKYIDGTNSLQHYPEGAASNYNPYWGNPSTKLLGAVDDNIERYTSIRGTGFINVKFPFVKGLAYRFEANAERGTTTVSNFHHEQFEENTLLPGDIANPTQFLSKAYGNKKNGLSTTYLMNNLLTYDRSFHDHNLNILAGYTRDDTQTETLSTSGNDFGAFGSTVLGIYGLQNATTQQVSSNYLEAANVTYIGRINYNYKSKYYLQASFNRGGYSAFAPGKKFGNFPGASVAWAASEESFMKQITWLDQLKIRLSYGRTGNQGVSPYGTQSTVGTSTISTGYPSPGYTVFGVTPYQYSFPSQLGNQNLTWEKTAALNLAVDFSILHNRLTGSIDVYKSKTTDLLYQLSIPPVSGYNTVLTNIGQVDNKGIEINLNSVNVKTADGFKWETGYAFWLNRNKLVHITGVINPATGKENDDTGNSLFIGKSLGAVYDYTKIGIVQASDVAYIAANAAVPGDVKFADLNGDGKITAADRSVIGYSKENYNMNLSNTFTYKNFQLFFSMNAIIGGGKDNDFISTNLRGLDPGAVQIGNWLNQPYWTPSNPVNSNPRPNYGNPNGYGFYQARSFARLQNASFSYLFPKSITNKLRIDNLKVYVSATNLFTITNWIGLDPANGAQIGGNGGSSSSGVNQSTPIMRTVSFGLNVGF